MLTEFHIIRPSRRTRGTSSSPLFIIPAFFLYFSNELCYGYLRFEGNGKIPLGRDGKRRKKKEKGKDKDKEITKFAIAGSRIRTHDHRVSRVEP